MVQNGSNQASDETPPVERRNGVAHAEQPQVESVKDQSTEVVEAGTNQVQHRIWSASASTGDPYIDEYERSL